MADYMSMTREQLAEEQAQLQKEYQRFQAMGLKLNMARGQAPAPVRWIWQWAFCR